MDPAEFDYDLPAERIAQTPMPRRDQSRLLVFSRADGVVDHHHFADLPQWLAPGDVLVLNNSRVIPARLRGVKADTGAGIEVLLADQNDANDWWAMLRPGKRVRSGTALRILDAQQRFSHIGAVVSGKSPDGLYRLEFSGTSDLLRELDGLGSVPLPPYIRRSGSGEEPEDRFRYQTVYSREAGSVAAPTAGLHFTESLLERLRDRGIRIGELTLHVGPGTFAPIKVKRLDDHVMHSERFELPAETATLVNRAKQCGHRVVAVGTTTVRVLEHLAAEHGGCLRGGRGRTSLFIRPPHEFLVVDQLITNFHLPRSTLLMLVCAFASPGQTGGRAEILRIYREAVRRNYRFYSYGDAMLIR